MQSNERTAAVPSSLGAGAVIGLVGLIAAAELIQPVDHSMTNAAQLRAAALHPASLRISSALILLAAAVAPIAMLTLGSIVPDRGRGLARAGGLVGMLAAVGLTTVAIHQLLLIGIATAHPAHAAAILHAVDRAAVPLILVFVFALPVALLLIAAALGRAHFLPRWVIVLAVAYPVTEFLPSFSASDIIHHGLGLAAYGYIAARLAVPGWERSRTSVAVAETWPAELRAR